MVRYVLNASCWWTLLNDFSDSVKEGLFEKLPYEQWRTLWKSRLNDVLITFDGDLVEISSVNNIILYSKQFDWNNNSFAEFLWNAYDTVKDLSISCVALDKNKEEDKMNINDNLASSSTSSTITYNEYCGYNPATITNPSNTTWSDSIGAVSLSDDFCRKSECPYNNKTEKKTEKENEKMNFNFDFGKVNADAVRMSPYGIAIKNRDNKWVSFNAKTQEVIDVDGFNFSVDGMLWKMPVAVSAVKVGDVIVHNRKPMYVVAIDDGIWAADIYEGEKKSIMPLTNMFGFNFVTKIVSIMDMNGAFNFGVDNTPTAENPFGGNFMQTMLMCQMFGDGKSDMNDLFSGDIGKFMMLSMMTGSQNPFATMFGGNK